MRCSNIGPRGARNWFSVLDSPRQLLSPAASGSCPRSARLFLRRGNPMWLPSPGRTRRSAPTHPAVSAPPVGFFLRPFVEGKHAAVAVGIHLDGQVERGAGLQFPEEVHHAGVAREHLEHHVALVAKVPPARAIVHVGPDDPDRVLVTVNGLEAPNDAGRLLELHLLDDPLELVGLLARRDRQGLFLRERHRADKQQSKGAGNDGLHGRHDLIISQIPKYYFNGRMALWAALMSGSGNTPRIRTATDATVSTATEAGDITTRTP